MAPPKAVLFDVDGTLIDTVDLHARAWVEALQHFSPLAMGLTAAGQASAQEHGS